jgi:hypothetical protein
MVATLPFCGFGYPEAADTHFLGLRSKGYVPSPTLSAWFGESTGFSNPLANPFFNVVHERET